MAVGHGIWKTFEPLSDLDYTAGLNVDENSCVDSYLAKECSPDHLDSIFGCRTPQKGFGELVKHHVAILGSEQCPF